MNKRETEAHIVKYLDAYLTARGFKHRKSNREEIEYIRKIDRNNFDSFGLSTINYYDSHKLRFGFGKRIGVVEDIMAEINKAVPFTNPPYDKKTTTLGFGYNSYNGLNKDGCFGYMETEQHVKDNVKKVIDFTEQHALPLLEKFNDLREIDKRINGEGENFWATTSTVGGIKPFNLGGRFVFRRIIIAKLSGRDDYEEFIQKIKDNANKIAKENNRVIDWNDLSLGVPYTIEYLKNIKPLY